MEKHSERLSWPVLAALAALFVFSLYLGINRIFQVDEVQYAFEARKMAEGRMDIQWVGVHPLLLGPLTWLAGSAAKGADVLVRLRLPFVGLFWANVALMVKGAGFRLRSREGLVAAVLAGTLAPLWDYGFEIRHDVALVTGVLWLWVLMRLGQARVWRFVLAGGLVVGLQFIAFKAFMFTIPILGIGLLRAWREGQGKWGLRTAGILAGSGAALVLGRVVNGVAGTWVLFWGSQGSAVHVASTAERFTPWPTFLRFFGEAPLLAWAGVAALVVPFLGARTPREWLRHAAWPEWVFAWVALGMLLANPTPFPYNLLHLVPAFFLLVMAHREPLVRAWRDLAPAARHMIAFSFFLFQVGPWAQATWRHVEMDNDRQCELIAYAEEATDPREHKVFDGAGLVNTRDPANPHWLIHTFTIRNFQDGSWMSMREALAKNPTPVVLVSYRTAMLPVEDRAFIEAHYVPLAADCYVLGCQGEGAFSWEALAGGRYLLGLVQGKGAAPGPVILDGREQAPGPLTLGRGQHRFEVPPGCQVQVVWLGPKANQAPRLGPAPRPLFVNWY